MIIYNIRMLCDVDYDDSGNGDDHDDRDYHVNFD